MRPLALLVLVPLVFAPLTTADAPVTEEQRYYAGATHFFICHVNLGAACFTPHTDASRIRIDVHDDVLSRLQGTSVPHRVGFYVMLKFVDGSTNGFPGCDTIEFDMPAGLEMLTIGVGSDPRTSTCPDGNNSVGPGTTGTIRVTYT